MNLARCFALSLTALAAAGGLSTAAPPAKPAGSSEVETDLRTIIGGNFAPDHLGPTAYDAIVKRARAKPARYLGVLMSRVVGSHPEAGWLSSSYLSLALTLVSSPALARATARRLLPLFEAALEASTPPPANDQYRAFRLRQRIAELKLLAR